MGNICNSTHKSANVATLFWPCGKKKSYQTAPSNILLSHFSWNHSLSGCLPYFYILKGKIDKGFYKTVPTELVILTVNERTKIYKNIFYSV